MAFATVTILMDTLHQHFLQPTPRFPLRNRTKVKLLYKNLSSLQTSLEQDFRVGECNEAIKALEAQMRDASVELRFQIEHHLTLFYLGKSMKLRLHSAQNLLPILNRAIKGTETMDFNSVMDILAKHFTLPVSGMPAHIKKRVKSFCTQHQRFLYHKQYYYYGGSEDEQESDDEQESKNEQEAGDKQESMNRLQSDDELESSHKERMYMLCEEAESIIRQELRAPSYLNQYIKQRMQARQRICQLFMQGIRLTSYIKKELLKVKNAYDQSKNSQNNNTASTRPEHENITIADSLQQTSKSTIKMVGCDDEFNTIMDNLNQRSSKRDIFSIVGMGGIGKTTLARKIYEDASFISRFDCQAWVTISQEYNPRQVFQSLLHSLDPRDYKNNDELAVQVYKCLKGRRYLIVIDDIWSTDVWDDLIRCFQDDNNGSRILLTTRLKNVAKYAGSGRNFCHTKCFLGPDESWNLFCNKMLSKRIILSPEFENIAREIVEKCKGLPLAITVAAGLLSNTNQTIDEWEHIAKNVSTLSLDHCNQCENIIHLSYTFLPHHLRLCFLSFGCFPEDYEVDEDVIVDFWVSEGFLKVLKSKRLEDVARESLQDLVDRYLVLICKERSSKLSRLYQMHDVLRELALIEAQKENLSCFKEDFGIGLRCKRILPINSSHISQPLSIQSRICNYNRITPTSSTTSLIGIGYPNITRLSPPWVNQVHAHFKFSRAFLVGEFIDAHNIFLEIVGLVHLRWLNIHCRLNIHYLPLFMLRNLQKLEVYLYSSCEPLDIWGLPQLRNLSVSHSVVTLVPPRSVHHNLESIRSLDYRSCTKELFVRIPNLRILAVTTDHKINPKCKPPNWFESLAYLYKLEELVVGCRHLHWEFKTIYSLGLLSLENFLSNLKKLTLYCTFLKWKDMDVVSTLSKLEDLELLSGAVEDQKWEPKDGGFCQLKFLKILWCGLQCWEATSDHFPVLEDLVLSHIDIEEIPSDFVDITTLKSIKLFSCSESLISSAERIQKERQEYGDDAFVVDISR